MGSVTAFLAAGVASIWGMLVDSALLLLVGIALAGLIRVVLNEGSIRWLLGRSPRTEVFRAALFGVPLTLCSCSVLPVAYQLRRSGLGRGGTVSFLISTPETGVDSVLLTYSLTDPVLTVARPLTAFATAAVAGLIESAFGRRRELETEKATVCSDCQSIVDPAHPGEGTRVGPIWSAWWGLRYAFTTLLSDLAPYLLLGYVLAGLAGVLLGGTMHGLPDALRSGWGGYLGALIIGLPLYICATSSTPLAAALLAAGFSPGAMLVFMLVSPATNVASLVVIGKILKRWALVRYLLVIVIMAVLAGLATDQVYSSFGLATRAVSSVPGHESGWLQVASAAVLAALILHGTAVKTFHRIRSPR